MANLETLPSSSPEVSSPLQKQPLPPLPKLPSPTLLTDQKPTSPSSLILQVELLHASAEDLDSSREQLENHLQLITSSQGNLLSLKRRLLSLRALITNDLLQIEKLLTASDNLSTSTSLSLHIASKGVTKVAIRNQPFQGVGDALRRIAPSPSPHREAKPLKGPRGTNNKLTQDEKKLKALLSANPNLLNLLKEKLTS